ncbi:hypothetical protein [Roseimicrobium sp. ORNL1]|uniref:hypothetical protein n=1 Tax=Roseimicrobium sp. ORNL1 TaxID=2711231 RepID=UPI0013E1BEA8|nr:hypothetical protein [Roseimicrobium sp. ORNL1]QIF04815.1 hypothetical protein G5S37_25965 [Roseimicrobium sp. ORNL1]
MNRIILTFVFLAFTVGGDSVSAAGQDKWAWSAQLPAQLATKSGRSNRTSDAVHELFRGPPRPPGIQDVLDAFGLPDAFSPQLIYSKTKGTGGPSRAGGTLRYLLTDGSEVHIWTPDFHAVGFAIRYPTKGRPDILYK